MQVSWSSVSFGEFLNVATAWTLLAFWLDFLQIHIQNLHSWHLQLQVPIFLWPLHLIVLWNIAWFVFSLQKPLWDRISNALPNSIKTEEEEYPMSTTILALIHHEIISEKFVVFNLELFRSTASMTMNFKKKTFRDKNVDPFNLVCPQLEPAFTRSFCQTAHILPGPTVGSWQWQIFGNARAQFIRLIKSATLRRGKPVLHNFQLSGCWSTVQPSQVFVKQVIPE